MRTSRQKEGICIILNVLKPHSLILIVRVGWAVPTQAPKPTRLVKTQSCTLSHCWRLCHKFSVPPCCSYFRIALLMWCDYDHGYKHRDKLMYCLDIFPDQSGPQAVQSERTISPQTGSKTWYFLDDKYQSLIQRWNPASLCHSSPEFFPFPEKPFPLTF